MLKVWVHGANGQKHNTQLLIVLSFVSCVNKRLVKNVEIHFKTEATLMKISEIDKVLILMSAPNKNNNNYDEKNYQESLCLNTVLY